jgi:hypothetical protein
MSKTCDESAARQSPGPLTQAEAIRRHAPCPKRFCRSLRLAPGVSLSGWRGARPSRPRGVPASAPQESELAVALADAGGSPSWPRLTHMRVPSAMHRSRQKGEAGALEHWGLGACHSRIPVAGWHALVLSDNQQGGSGYRAASSSGSKDRCVEHESFELQ